MGAEKPQEQAPARRRARPFLSLRGANKRASWPLEWDVSAVAPAPTEEDSERWLDELRERVRKVDDSCELTKAVASAEWVQLVHSLHACLSEGLVEEDASCLGRLFEVLCTMCLESEMEATLRILHEEVLLPINSPDGARFQRRLLWEIDGVDASNFVLRLRPRTGFATWLRKDEAGPGTTALAKAKGPLAFVSAARIPFVGSRGGAGAGAGAGGKADQMRPTSLASVSSTASVVRIEDYTKETLPWDLFLKYEPEQEQVASEASSSSETMSDFASDGYESDSYSEAYSMASRPESADFASAKVPRRIAPAGGSLAKWGLA